MILTNSNYVASLALALALALRSLLTFDVVCSRLGPSFDLPLSMRMSSHEAAFHTTSESPRYKCKPTVMTPLIIPAGRRRGVRPTQRAAVPVPPEALLSSSQHVAFIYFPTPPRHRRQYPEQSKRRLPLEGCDSGAPERTWLLLSTCCPRGFAGLNLAIPRGQGLTSAMKV
jgi:hypothetical protein